jgi:hypothetical protein
MFLVDALLRGIGIVKGIRICISMREDFDRKFPVLQYQTRKKVKFGKV